MTPGRLLRWAGAALLAGIPLVGGCTAAVPGAATAAPATGTPSSAAELERLLVTTVPSGLPRVPDEQLRPPAGEKSVDDVASYAEDPLRERELLEKYGYRYGWERFWSSGQGATTSVFVDQFDHRAGAGGYAADLAGNDAELYSGMLREDPPELPGGCWLMTLTEARNGLAGPAAFARCGHGVFSVAVTAVAGSPEAAVEEVSGVLREQLDRLPPDGG